MFAAGACYENPDGAAFYENPLAAPKAPDRSDSLERHPVDLLDSSVYDNPSSPTSGSGSEWFCFVYCQQTFLTLKAGFHWRWSRS